MSATAPAPGALGDPYPFRLTAAEALGALSSGSLSGPELLRACLSRIAAREPVVRAWAALDADLALAAADRTAASKGAGPLRGIPVAIKDVIDVEGLPTQYNSPLYEDYRPASDADCVALLRQAGAVILGKTETVEFAAGGRRAPTRHPLDPERTPGGSSSGSAAAVADFHVPIAVGTQSAGSVIRPASYCGIYAMKPTWGTVGRGGIKPYAPSLDTVGWFARSVADLRLVAEVLGVPSGTLPREQPTAGAKIALCRTPAWPLAQASTAGALTRAAARLREAGAAVVEIALPAAFEGLIAARRTIARAEGAASFLAEARLHGARLHPDVRAMPENRSNLSPARVRAAYDLAASCRAAFDEIASGFAGVLAPSAAGEAPIGLQSTGETDFNEIWTLLHTPCLNLPAGVGESGLPIGVTLTSSRFSDFSLLAFAAGIAPLLASGVEARHDR